MSNAERGVAFSAEGFLYVISYSQNELSNGTTFKSNNIFHMRFIEQKYWNKYINQTAAAPLKKT